MSINESIIEDAALTSFGELGYAVGHGPHMAPGEPAAEWGSFGEVALVGRLWRAVPFPRYLFTTAETMEHAWINRVTNVVRVSGGGGVTEGLARNLMTEDLTQNLG